MSVFYNVSIIGAGNVAWHLTQALENAGHHIGDVYSRDARNAKALIKKLYSATLKESLDYSHSSSQIFIIAISDDAIAEIATKLILPKDALLVHTSGTVSLDAIGYALENYGVFYPLQSFSKSRRADFKEVPILLECSGKKAREILFNLAKSVSKNVSFLSGDKRKVLHLSAVFASNFTNHLLTIAKQICAEEKVDFLLLEPLIIETINKSLEIGPENAQTGPAARGDLQTMDRHLALIGDGSLKNIYKVISQHILDQRDWE